MDKSIKDPIGFWEDSIGRAITDFRRSEIVSAQGAARILGITQRRVVALIHAKRIPASKFLGRWIIRRSDLNLDLVKERKPGYPKGRKRKSG